MTFLCNIKYLTLIRLEQIYRDYFDLNTILALTIAGTAGYFFQSNYVMSMIADQNAARFVAMLACIGFTIFVKNFSFRVDDNPKWGAVINKYIKIILGGAITVTLLAFDSYTSNVAIENSGLQNTATEIEKKIDNTSIEDLRTSKNVLLGEHEHYAGLEKSTGVSYKITKRNLRTQITRYDSLIAVMTLANQETIKKANNLRIATVSTEDNTSTKSSYFGSLLLMLAFGIEWLSTGSRGQRKTAESAIDCIPYSITMSAIATATVYNKRTSVEFSQTTTETKQELPLDVVNSILAPQNGNQAVELYARGVINAENGWSVRKIAKEFFGNENKRTHVNELVHAERLRLMTSNN